MKVTYIDHMGTDLSVVNAARVSFGKRSWWGNEEDWLEFDAELELKDADKRLIRFLARHNHWTPFGHTAVTMHIKAPIFVARQLGKHQVGLVWNEVSRRYVKDEPEIYVPKVWRKAAENVKQGSSDEAVDLAKEYQFTDTPEWGWDDYTVEEMFQENCERPILLYNRMIEKGVCTEQARMVLPQSMYTEWYWTGSIAAFARVVNLRLDPHSQRETQEVASQIDTVIRPLFPVSWEALVDDR